MIYYRNENNKEDSVMSNKRKQISLSTIETGLKDSDWRVR